MSGLVLFALFCDLIIVFLDPTEELLEFSIVNIVHRLVIDIICKETRTCVRNVLSLKKTKQLSLIFIDDPRSFAIGSDMFRVTSVSRASKTP